jgi:hypothetical protein
VVPPWASPLRADLPLVLPFPYVAVLHVCNLCACSANRSDICRSRSWRTLSAGSSSWWSPSRHGRGPPSAWPPAWHGHGPPSAWSPAWHGHGPSSSGPTARWSSPSARWPTSSPRYDETLLHCALLSSPHLSSFCVTGNSSHTTQSVDPQAVWHLLTVRFANLRFHGAGGPPPPPAAPAVKVGGGAPAEGRGALLSSIAGFSKGGLKKATTVDKSAPILSTISLFLSKAGANASADPPCTYRRAPSYCTETEKAPPGGGGPMGGLFAGGIPKLGGRGRATASPPVGGPRT